MHTPFIFFLSLKQFCKNKTKTKVIFFLLNLIINLYFYIPFDCKLIALSEFMNIFAHVCILKKVSNLESTYTKSSMFVANILTHYKNPVVKFLFFFSFFVALTSLILNQQSNIIYLLKKPRYFIFSDNLSEYPYLELKF
jgi:hypothetical protein